MEHNTKNHKNNTNGKKNRRVITKYEIWQYYDHCSGWKDHSD
jgi:hypothetical protein